VSERVGSVNDPFSGVLVLDVVLTQDKTQGGADVLLLVTTVWWQLWWSVRCATAKSGVRTATSS